MLMTGQNRSQVQLTRFLKQPKFEIQKVILENTGLKWHYPDGTGKWGTTTTGNIAPQLLHNQANWNSIIDQIPLDEQENLPNDVLVIRIKEFSSITSPKISKHFFLGNSFMRIT